MKVSAVDSPEPTLADHSRAGLFLMTNNFETGGSERQFALLAQNLWSEQFQLHTGCLSRQGPFADGFGDIPEFPLGGSLFGWTSLGARWRLGRHLRRNRVQIAHAFDFYTNLALIPAARLARVPVVIGSHRQLGDLMTAAQFRVQAAAFRWCDAVVCNSLAGANRLAAAGYLWAFSALTASPGARGHYDKRRDTGDGHAAAQRNLFGRLLGCLHHCLLTGQHYDENTAFSTPPATATATATATAA